MDIYIFTMDDTCDINGIHGINGSFYTNMKTEVEMKNETIKEWKKKYREAWEDELHESEATLDDVLLDLNIYEENDSCFPSSYNMEVVQVMLLSRIAHSLEQISEALRGGADDH